MLEKGKIIKINSDDFTVKVDDDIFETKSRGKFRNLKIKPLVGDNVLINKEDKVIEEVLPRENYLLRPPVANIDIALIVTSITEPNLNLTLLDKLISIITINKIEPVIVWTKLDLANKDELKEIKRLSKYYESIGIKTFTNKKVRKIKKYIAKKVVTVCGQTGAGKSSLINKFNKELNLATDKISDALGRGKHTTRIVELFNVANFYVVDTPGFSAIDINEYTKDEIKKSFVEFKNITCKFNDCRHIKENGCEVIKLVESGKILKSRYENYLNFLKESK